jgi:uncharacterized protein YqgV (UPF0045/DUF77 family)
MHVAVEMSLYPLTGEFTPPILDFIERLKAQPDLVVVTNSMSTQVSGDYDRVFAALHAEIRRSFEGPHRAVLVMKVLGGSG